VGVGEDEGLGSGGVAGDVEEALVVEPVVSTAEGEGVVESVGPPSSSARGGGGAGRGVAGSRAGALAAVKLFDDGPPVGAEGALPAAEGEGDAGGVLEEPPHGCVAGEVAPDAGWECGAEVEVGWGRLGGRRGRGG
jgi:hypothetical protein